MSRRALILLDFQVGVCGTGGVLGSGSGLTDHTQRRGVPGRLAQLLPRARSSDDSVFHVGVRFEDGYRSRTNRSDRFAGFEKNRLMLGGSDQTRFLDEAAPAEDECVFWKTSVCPFATTPLEPVLRAHEVSELLLAGVATNAVVESTARYAGDRGFTVKVIEDLCASYDDVSHEFAVSRTLPLFGSIVQADSLY